MNIAIAPGSFDPMTLGHRDIIERAARLFDKVIVAIMINPDKRGMFDMSERKRIAELTLAGIDKVEVLVSDGYLADLAGRLGAVAIVKGVRTTVDFEYEQKMAVFNHLRNSDCETIYLPSYGDMANISSTLARSRLLSGASTSDVLDGAAEAYIRGLDISNKKQL